MARKSRIRKMGNLRNAFRKKSTSKMRSERNGSFRHPRFRKLGGSRIFTSNGRHQPSGNSPGDSCPWACLGSRDPPLARAGLGALELQYGPFLSRYAPCGRLAL
ncbi:unnamed protein product [Prunus armeniaca]